MNKKTGVQFVRLLISVSVVFLLFSCSVNNSKADKATAYYYAYNSGEGVYMLGKLSLDDVDASKGVFKYWMAFYAGNEAVSLYKNNNWNYTEIRKRTLALEKKGSPNMYSVDVIVTTNTLSFKSEVKHDEPIAKDLSYVYSGILMKDIMYTGKLLEYVDGNQPNILEVSFKQL